MCVCAVPMQSDSPASNDFIGEVGECEETDFPHLIMTSRVPIQFTLKRFSDVQRKGYLGEEFRLAPYVDGII